MSPLKRSARAQPARSAKQAQRRSRRAGPVWLRLLLIVVVVALLLDVLPAPWALDIGGQFSLLGDWDGFGQVRASDGGTYLLFIHLHGGITNGVTAQCSFRGCDALTGNAQLCTRSGQRYTFGLYGKEHTWLSTDGALTDLYLSDGTHPVLPKRWVIAFHGIWHGGALPIANTNGSFTKVFSPAGAIRTPSLADTGTAHGELRKGPLASFDAECRALASGLPLTH